MDYAKCSICKEKDFTNNLIVPCKCDKYVHRSCLNKKRIKEPAYFDQCPICAATYNMEKKEIPEWKKITQIVFSVIFDFMTFIITFVAASSIFGWVLVKLGIKFAWTDKPFFIGSIVMIGILGFISFLYGLMLIMKDNIFFLHNLDFRGENALFLFLIIGAIVLISASIYWIYKTLKERIEHHKRSIGVKEFEVKDYTRGIEDI